MIPKYRVCKSRTRLDPEIALRNSILRHPNAVGSKNVATKRCSVAHKARYVFQLDVVRINHFRVHNLQKSRDVLIDPIVRNMWTAKMKKIIVFRFVFRFSLRLRLTKILRQESTARSYCKDLKLPILGSTGVRWITKESHTSQNERNCNFQV